MFPTVRVLAFEPRKENIKGAENGKLFAICSGTGNHSHSIVCSKSFGVPRSLVMTIRRHSDPSPGELSSNSYKNIRKFRELTLRMPMQSALWESQYPSTKGFLCKMSI